MYRHIFANPCYRFWPLSDFFSHLYVIGIKDVADENRGTREVLASIVGESLEEPNSRSI